MFSSNQLSEIAPSGGAASFFKAISSLHNDGSNWMHAKSKPCSRKVTSMLKEESKSLLEESPNLKNNDSLNQTVEIKVGR